MDRLPEWLELSYIPRCGEGLITLKEFQAGEIIIVKKFDVSVLNNDVLENYCSYCLKNLLASKIKCLCCKSNFYCSNKCKDNDLKKHHRLECLLSRKLMLVNQRPTRSQRLLLRSLCSEFDSKVKCEINLNFENFDQDLIKYFMNGIALMKHYLEPEELLPNPQDMLLKSCQLKGSCFELTSGTLQSDQHIIGLGFSETVGKMNHSCKPNSGVELLFDAVTVFAKTLIKAGEEITISYLGESENETDKEFLREHYYFNCECRYCFSNIT